MQRRTGIGNDIFLLSLQLFAGLCAGYFICYPITDSDIFWHLASGREMVAQHAILYYDPFSYTTSGVRWVNLHWLFQVIMYLLQTAGGYWLLLAVKGTAVAGAAWLIFGAFNRCWATAAAALGAAAVVYCQRYLVPLRPIIATLPLMGLFIASFEGYCRCGRRRRLLPALIGQVVWVNCQGLFMLGPIIAAAYGTGEWFNQWCARRFPRRFSYPTRVFPPARCRPLFLSVPALLAISLVNPYGWRAFEAAFKLFMRINPSASNIYAKTIIENMPLPRMAAADYSSYVLIIAAVAAAAAASMLFAPRTVRFAHVALASTGLLLAWMAQRNGILFTLLALPALLWNCHQLSLTMPKHAGSAARIITAGAAILVCYAAVNHTRMLLTWPHALSPFSHPTETAELIKRQPVSGRLFNADRYGGYLLWRLHPPLQVSHDTRWTLRSDDLFREYLDLTENPEHFIGHARKWGITHVVLPVGPVDRYLQLAAALYRDPGWKLMFTDGTEVLFTADTGGVLTGVDLDSLPVIEAIAASLAERFGKSQQVYDEAVHFLGRWCAAAGAYKGARRIFLSLTTQKRDF